VASPFVRRAEGSVKKGFSGKRKIIRKPNVRTEAAWWLTDLSMNRRDLEDTPLLHTHLPIHKY